jgi:hypothetical protein
MSPDGLWRVLLRGFELPCYETPKNAIKIEGKETKAREIKQAAVFCCGIFRLFF